LFLCVLFELASFLVHEYVFLPRGSLLAYEPPQSILLQGKYAEYLAKRDPILGWPEHRERHIPRPSPGSPTSETACISLYGDSFTFSAEVDDRAAWGNVVAKKLGCRVDNFGVSGYGTGQAYLRFRLNEQDNAPVTILGIYPLNILRNINQYRFFMARQTDLGFKPRLALEGAELKEVPMPSISYEQSSDMYETPEKYFTHEAFLPDTKYGPMRFSFPWSLSMLRFILLKEHLVVDRITGKPRWIEYWEPNHPTNSLELMSAIVSRFNQECLQRQKQCLVVIYPMPGAIDLFREGGAVFQDFSDSMSAEGIEVLDLTVGFNEKLAGRSLCSLQIENNCRKHFNVEGYAIVAELVTKWLEKTQPFASQRNRGF
ncbi:MAG: hypothetical protein AAF512_06810, partial [Pseudomonadota bacterium]